MIPDRWYPICETHRLRHRPIALRRLGRDWVLWRDARREVCVMPAFCPHRGAALADGRVVDGELECPWHGFRFGADGLCTLMPCEGHEARAGRALALEPAPAREAFGLIWLWHGEPRSDYPEIEFFEQAASPRGDSTSASYILPYHYSRMVETNLDIHHTPFVHGAFIPTGTRVRDFDATLEGDCIRSSGRLVRENRPDSAGMPFRADLILPCVGLVELTPKLRIIVSSTPVDEGHTWLYSRYDQDYTALRPLGKLLTWVSVQSELRLVQRQDWRVFAGMAPGTIDAFPYAFVHADKAIALYRKRRAELLAARRPAAAGATPAEPLAAMARATSA